MIRFALSSLLARRRRAAMTAFAVLLGVSMISGTFVFTDTIHAAFRQLFSDASAGADVVVSSRQDLNTTAGAPASIPVSLIRQIRRLPGVAAAASQVTDTATIVGRDGRAIKRTGAPTLALSYLRPPFTGLTLLTGRRPTGSDQVALDQATADSQGYRVGDRVPIVTGQPVRRFRISGLVRLGGASLGGATVAVFDLATARRLYGKEGTSDLVYVAGAKGAAPEGLVREIRPLLPPELVVRTTQGQVDSNVQRLANQLGILTGGLLAFGFIAVFVGAFVIFNTFSITVTQRAQEFALLRALGASRRQVLASVLVEGGGIGAVASIAGLAGGLLAASAIRALFTGVGFDLPETGLVFKARTALIGVGVGVLVTLAAGLAPALRATRVAPVQAIRESAVPARTRGGRARAITALAAVLACLGLALIVTSSGSTAARLTTSATGAVMLVVALVALSPRAVPGLTAIVGWPLARDNRILGRLARENAARNPGRTAVSASSLMIGLALVLFVTVFANGLQASTKAIIARTLIGDFTIQSQDGTSSIPGASARAVAVVPNVLAVSSLKTAKARLGNDAGVTAVGIDPTTLGQVYGFDWIDGSSATLNDLTLGDAILERDTASAAHVRVGQQVTVTTETGLRETVTVRGIYQDRALLAGFALPRIEFDRIFHQPRLQRVFVKLGPGADVASAADALNQALGAFPGVVARSQRQLQNDVAGRVNSILILFYALLAMSVLMSLLGIVNTLTLSIHERTRELGMLRAVGMTPGQASALIRGESMITAGLGTLVGVGLGLFLAWVVTRALGGEGIVFSIPWAQVLGLVVIGLLAGWLASLGPARRAARLDVLAAIAHH